METTSSSGKKFSGGFTVMLLLLVAVLSLFFYDVFLPGQTLFSNDGPLGRLISDCHRLPDRFTGCWGDLNGIGFNGGASTPGISLGLQYLLKPVWFSKLYALLSLVILGMGAWCFFAQLRLAPLACLLGGLAAALNSCFFSAACWGVAAQAITAGMIFFALAALADTTSPLRWLRVMLAGFAVGMGVIEGADVGAIFSLYAVVFVIYQTWIGEGAPAKRVVTGLSRVALVAVCAGFIAAQTVSSLVGTFITGVVGTQQDVQTKEMRWDWATQWSLPVEETTSLIVPGLFGYRMDTLGGGCYWGRVGMDPAVDRYLQNGRQGTPPHGFMRYSGGGFYAGDLVVLLGFWAFAQSLRKKDSVFSLAQRQWLWFWLVIAFVSLLIAYGRFAPFYQVLYHLPYFSTIRNPVKFIYPVSFALIVMFAYGVDGLYRKYLQPQAAAPAPPPAPVPAAVAAPAPASRRAAPKVAPKVAPKAAPKAPRAQPVKGGTSFEKSWMLGCWVVLGLAVLAWLLYASERPALLTYLHGVLFHEDVAEAIADFSILQVGWFVLFFGLSAVLLGRIFAGTFAGKRAVWGGLALGLLLVLDFAQANWRWVIYWNYPAKYATNPIIELLRNRPYEARVTMLAGQQPANLPSLDKLYRLEWLQQQFPYYNIQTLDIPDMPRKPQDLAAYAKALSPAGVSPTYTSLARVWQLTNTRYILALAEVQDPFNQELAPYHESLRLVRRFDIVPKPGEPRSNISAKLTAESDDNGAFALFEFMGALPRAKFYDNFQVVTNNQTVLDQLASPGYDPRQTVLVSDPLPAAAAAAGTGQNPGTVDFASYDPKDIVLKSTAPAAGVLLLNDHFDPNWKVFVDGQPETLLRCDFIMRGVWVPAGAHTVEFKFLPPYKLLYLTLAVTAAGLLLLGVVIVASRFTPKKV